MGNLGYDRVPGEFYPTPPENLDCLASFVDLSQFSIWECACGAGHLAKRIEDIHQGPMVATDLFDRGYGVAGQDFLEQKTLPPVLTNTHRRPLILTNPPFKGDMPEQFIEHALALTENRRGAVAMFLRNDRDMAVKREHLFEGHPAYAMKVCVLKRPRWFEGSTGSPRHNYAWYFWDWTTEANDRAASIRYIHPKNASPIQ